MDIEAHTPGWRVTLTQRLLTATAHDHDEGEPCQPIRTAPNGTETGCRCARTLLGRAADALRA